MPTIKPDVLGEAWRRFAGSVLVPAQVLPVSVQWVETKRAFYAGAYALAVATETLGSDAYSEEEGTRQWEAIVKELGEFYDKMTRGEA